MAWTRRPPTQLSAEDLDAFRDGVHNSAVVPRSSRKAYLARLHSLHQLLFEARILDLPPKRGPAGASIAERLEVIAGDEIRRTISRYVHTRSAVLAPKSVESLINDLIPFATFICDRFPEIGAIRQLERLHIEAFLVWNRSERTWRGRKACQRKVGAAVIQTSVLAVRNFLDEPCGAGPTVRHGG